MAEIKHFPVVSSNIHSVGHNKDTRTLEIKFKNGSTYSYRGVSRIMYEGIFKAESPGAFVQRWIVKGKYKFNKKK
ncbi:MAG: KTSC domain-containing protein [Candidatus Paceibacterota bacterium]